MKFLRNLLILAAVLLIPAQSVFAFDLQQHVRGRILLAVESRGEAWYVNVLDDKRFALGRPADALKVMGTLGLGITNKDLQKIPLGFISSATTQQDSDQDGLSNIFEVAIGSNINAFDTDNDGFSDYQEVFNGFSPASASSIKPAIDKALTNRLKGRILLQVESRGEAWYVDPVQGKRFFLGDPESAFLVLRYLGLGISNANLAAIQISPNSPTSFVPPVAPSTPTVPSEPLADPAQSNPAASILTPQTDYLIIVPDELFQSALQLKTYREQLGHVVSVQSLSQIPKTSNQLLAEDIDAWLESFAGTQSALEYVVLLGDVLMLPSETVDIDPDPNGVSYTHSDLLYAVAGTGFVVDSGVNNVTEENFAVTLMVGRIPIRTNEEFSTYFQKMKVFENTFEQRKTILFFGYPGELGYVTRRDKAIAEQAGYTTIIKTRPNFADLQTQLAALQAYEEDVLATLQNPDIAIVMYYGHGSEQENDPLNVDNMAQWMNAVSPVLYLSGGCGFGDTNELLRSLSDQLVYRNNGAAASFGASKNGGYGMDYGFAKGFLSNLNSENTLGDLYLDALTQSGVSPLDDFGNAFVSPSDLKRYVYYFYLRMGMAGDPAMSLK